MKSQIESRFSVGVVNMCILIATLVLTVGLSIAIAKAKIKPVQRAIVSNIPGL